MKSFAIIAALFAAAAMAIPLEVRDESSDYNACPGTIMSSTQCCETDLAGLLSISCKPPSTPPTSAEDFKYICGQSGTSAACCALPALGQAIACQAPAGSG
uniref:Geo1 protein n=1 Tax=Geosmithia sp. 8 MK-2014 TaxID=1447008 RepID=A0A090C6L0_9HYPO|nr:class II hydrophobin [Geosmithia sp. 8 MK-2014]